MTCFPVSAAMLLAAINLSTGSIPAATPMTPVARGPTDARVETANRAATHEPESGAFVNGVQVYPWADGALYRLYTAPERVSDIGLQPGETLVAVAAGDTVRWIVGDTSSGAGEARRAHILVKPSVPGLRTNLLITTDRRVYHVELESTSRTAMAGIAWHYSQDELIALQRAQASAEAAAPVAPAVAIESLNFNYTLDGADAPWRPVRVFDDGRQTFIEFPNSTGDELPPLFITGADGKTQLVNYRVRGRYYVVDRLFSAAELRLGAARQQVVRIIRSDSASKHRRDGRRS